MNAYRIDGMTCDGCAKAVLRAVQHVASGREIRVDRSRDRVEIAGEPLDEAILRRAVEAAGFVYGGPA
jgi:copper chaperone